MRKAMMVFAVLGLAGAVAASACDAPAGISDIPDGMTATRDAMVAAQKAVVAYDAAVKAYSACLQDEQKKRVAAGGDRNQLEDQYARLQNAEVSKLEKVARQFNDALKNFKARNAS